MTGATRPADRDAAGLPDDMEDLQPSLARERTVLAWNRTGVAFLALGGALIRADPLVGLAVLALGGTVWALGYLHHRSMWTPSPRTRWLTRPRALRLIALSTALLALVGLAIAVLRDGRPPL